MKTLRTSKNNRNYSTVLLNIRKSYKDKMSDQEIYQVTKKDWNISSQQQNSIKYALAIYDSEVKAVFHIICWYRSSDIQGKWVFDGKIALPDIYHKYIGKRYRMYGPVQYIK